MESYAKGIARRIKSESPEWGIKNVDGVAILHCPVVNWRARVSKEKPNLDLKVFLDAWVRDNTQVKISYDGDYAIIHTPLSNVERLDLQENLRKAGKVIS